MTVLELRLRDRQQAVLGVYVVQGAPAEHEDESQRQGGIPEHAALRPA